MPGLSSNRGELIKRAALIVLLLIAAASVAYYYFYRPPPHPETGEIAYVLPLSLDAVDTTAELRNVVATLKGGERVRVLGRTSNWTHVRLNNGRDGWVESKSLVDANTFHRGQQLLEGLRNATPQAAGHADAVTNLHLDPSREATVLAELAENTKLAVFGRQLVPRPAKPGEATNGTSPKDAWYLVRAGSQAGWVLGRLVDLDVPAALANYAEGVNVVAWQVLRTVDDAGEQVPEYLVADRIGAEDVDFNHIRVFTWWAKHHKYVTAYVESGLSGYFPIVVTHLTDADYFASASPYFRLRLTDSDGNKFQAVYGMFDTIVRRVGVVDGWENDAMPPPAPREHRIRRARRHGAKRQ